MANSNTSNHETAGCQKKGAEIYALRNADNRVVGIQWNKHITQQT